MQKRTRTALVAGLLASTTVIALGPMQASAAPATPDGTPLTGQPVGDEYSFVDNRPGAVAPRSAQKVPGARYNKFGTPASIVGKLATGLSQDPEAAARQYLKNHRGVFALDATGVDNLETVATTPIGKGAVVLLRQRFGKLPAGFDGQVAVAVKAGDVLSVSSTLSPEVAAPEPATLTSADAVTAALKDAGLTRGQLADHRVRQVAVPMPGATARTAYEVVVLAADAEHGYTTYIDGRDGKVLVRENLVNFAEDNPHWKTFVSTPTTGADSRATWCAAAAPECSRVVNDPATGKAWDIDPETNATTQTTRGNSAYSVKFWDNASPQTPATPSATRDYTYPFTNQWNTARCDPATLASPQQADVDAATTNLFVAHNRMHDWSYHLGFTEATWNLQTTNTGAYGKGADAERGNAQQGANTQTTRNNANQATPPDGMTPVTNMYMWQPQAGAAYPPCVDGDFDTTVIGHEYSHAISNRMVGGPDQGISSTQGGAMGESWSDLLAMEYLFESGYAPRGNTPYVTGAYVTGDNVTGIRNYDMSNSPLNYSDYGYDRGPAVHSDGEIWSATNFDVRRNLIAKYGSGTRAQQESCANGQTPADACPGNRRWAQLVFDSFLLTATGQISMLDMRDNMITADALRFDGANADLLWASFAARGMGAGASVTGPSDTDPVPSFANPYTENQELTFRPAGAGNGKPVRLYIGDFEAGATPIADTDPATTLPETFTIAPGTYRFLAVGKGLGHKKWTQAIYPGGNPTVVAVLPANLASSTNGATITGDGLNLPGLIDDAEGSTWTGNNGVAGKTATVDLAGDAASLVSRVQVSGFAGQFAAVRQFEVLSCDATRGQDCATDAGYKTIYASPANAFTTGQFRPKSPELVVKSFTVRPTPATHVRFRALTNQCTANPLYAGEKDNDPRSTTDCATSASAAARQVNAAEFQVFGS